MMTTLIRPAALSLLLAGALCAPAFGQEQRPDVKISYADLDLTSPQGVKILDRRLSSAIATICPAADGLIELSRKRIAKQCQAAKRAEIDGARTIAIANAGRRTGAMASAN